MSIYLGGNNSRPYVGGTKINEAYLGGVKVLGGGLPVLAPNSMRLQFDEVGYDPTVGVWGNKTIVTSGWTATRRSSRVWDIRNDNASLADTLLPFSTLGTSPTTQPWRVLEVNKNSSWNSYWALFRDQPYLDNVPLFTINVRDDVTTMFYNCSSLDNSVAWAKEIAQKLQVYSTSNTFTNCKNNASIPSSFGGTKGRTRIFSKTGTGNAGNYTVVISPGDWIYTAVRGYKSSTGMRSYSRIAYESGTNMVRNNDYSSSYILYATASGSTGNKVSQESTVRWGYAEGTRMTCAGYRWMGDTNNPYANVYVDSFQFL